MSHPWVRVLSALSTLGIVGCVKQPSLTTLPPQIVTRVEQQLASATERPEVLGPVLWWHDSGLCLDVPGGWAGRGTDGQARLLSLESVDSGVRVELARSADSLGDRTGMRRLFQGDNRYRDLPALGLVAVETWVDDTPEGRTLQVWSAGAGPDAVIIEASFPSGWLIRGRQEVDGLLRNLCFEER